VYGAFAQLEKAIDVPGHPFWVWVERHCGRLASHRLLNRLHIGTGRDGQPGGDMSLIKRVISAAVKIALLPRAAALSPILGPGIAKATAAAAMALATAIRTKTTRHETNCTREPFLNQDDLGFTPAAYGLVALIVGMANLARELGYGVLALGITARLLAMYGVALGLFRRNLGLIGPMVSAGSYLMSARRWRSSGRYR
jgi:hypothetical protein